MAFVFVAIMASAIEGAFRAGSIEMLRYVAAALLVLCVVFMVKR